MNQVAWGRPQAEPWMRIHGPPPIREPSPVAGVNPMTVDEVNDAAVVVGTRVAPKIVRTGGYLDVSARPGGVRRAPADCNSSAKADGRTEAQRDRRGCHRRGEAYAAMSKTMKPLGTRRKPRVLARVRAADEGDHREGLRSISRLHDELASFGMNALGCKRSARRTAASWSEGVSAFVELDGVHRSDQYPPVLLRGSMRSCGVKLPFTSRSNALCTSKRHETSSIGSCPAGHRARNRRSSWQGNLSRWGECEAASVLMSSLNTR